MRESVNQAHTTMAFMGISQSNPRDERGDQTSRRGTGIPNIEDITMDGARLKNPALSLSGFCDKLLIGHLGDRHMNGNRVLDLGCGTGANGLYFAQNGCTVEMIDISEDAVRACAENARQLGVSVVASTGDVRQLSLEPNSYDLIILSYLLQFLRAEEGRQLIANCIAALKPGGDLYLSTFSVAEELFSKLEEDSKRDPAKVLKLDQSTFQFTNGRIVYFQTLEEVLANCSALTCKHVFEGKELDVSHGEPHYHSFIAYVGTKEGSRAS